MVLDDDENDDEDDCFLAKFYYSDRFTEQNWGKLNKNISFEFVCLFVFSEPSVSSLLYW